MSRRDKFTQEWIAQLEMQIRTNEANLGHRGAQNGFNQLASATERLRYQLESWQASPPKPRKKPAVVQGGTAKSNKAAPKSGPARKP
jgi:hypothetical protein